MIGSEFSGASRQCGRSIIPCVSTWREPPYSPVWCGKLAVLSGFKLSHPCLCLEPIVKIPAIVPSFHLWCLEVFIFIVLGLIVIFIILPAVAVYLKQRKIVKRAVIKTPNLPFLFSASLLPRLWLDSPPLGALHWHDLKELGCRCTSYT